jgi:hypothetical protein
MQPQEKDPAERQGQVMGWKLPGREANKLVLGSGQKIAKGSTELSLASVRWYVNLVWP